jgi:hypothetical protein
MLPDIELMTIPELERYLILNVDMIKRVAKHVITKKSIAIVMGCYHDEKKKKILYKKIDKVKCLIGRKNGTFKFSVEKVIDDDDKFVKNNPAIEEMIDACDDAFKITMEANMIMDLTDDNVKYTCGQCARFDNKKEECNLTGNSRKSGDEACDDDFSADLRSFHYDRWTEGPGAMVRRKSSR